MPRITAALFVMFALMGFTPSAQAQFAVIDVAALAQLIQQVQQMEQALQTAQNELTQVQQTYQSMTGSRGMQNLLSGINRNYLPPTWPQLPTALAAPMATTVSANAVLTPAQVAALSPAEQQLLNGARGNAALLQVATQEAYANSSNRFASIQQLINAIGSTTDQKGILELQARVQAEQGMLQNESTKLQVLYQAAQAQEWARRQRTHEQAIADVGSVRNLPPIGLNH
jgi:type IV secretion system protein VirB5